MDTTAERELREFGFDSPLIHRIPVDIFREVFSTLKDRDREALSACSRVSHRWHDLIIPLLFSDVVFRFKPDHTFLTLIDFITTHPHLFLRTRSLTLSGKYQEHSDDPRGHLEFRRWYYAVLDCEELSSILSRLPALSTLTLRHIEVDGRSIQDATPSIAVKTLSIAHFRDRGGEGWLASLGHLLRVVTPEALKLPTVRTMDSRGELLAHINVRPHRSADIRRLELQGNEVLDLKDSLSYFASILAPNSLTHLVLQHCFTYSISQLRTFIEAAGQRLESISLHLRPLIAGSEDVTALGAALGKTLCLPACLGSLTLIYPAGGRPTLHLVRGIVRTDLPRRIFPDILSHAPSTLRNISISLYVGDDAAAIYDLSELQSLEKPWFRQRFPQLQLLLIEITGVSSDTSPSLPELPELLQAGLLRIQTVRSEMFRVREWQQKLRNAFYDGRGNYRFLRDEELPGLSQLFTEIESFSGMTLGLLQFSHIGHVMLDIVKLDDWVVPRDEVYRFRQRAEALWTSWLRKEEDILS